MIYRIEVEVVTPVNPTEDPAAVKQAIANLFPTAEFEVKTGEVIAEAHSIDRFAELLAEQRILKTARTRLQESIEGSTVAFRVKKQAAFAGVINFALDETDELGDIDVRIRVEQPSPQRFVAEITAPTEQQDTRS